jgi:hypothetical protein
MSRIDEIKRLLELCKPAQRKEIFRYLQLEFPIHPVERQLNIEAEIILEVITRAGEFTFRMIRGVLAEAAFRVEVVDKLKAWRNTTPAGNLPYDFRLEDGRGAIRVQVKLQRSKAKQPMRAKEANREFSPDMHVVETQKTGAGTDRKTGSSTRPYHFGEFDILAVAMHPSTNRWDSFLYTVADWLLAKPTEPLEMLKFQPVAAAPNEDWTDDFQTAVTWFRAGMKKKIRAQ